MKMKVRVCELCDQQASLYCPSDSAFLCWNCDDTVHRANFLVARHLRHLLCSECNRFAQTHIAGATPPCLAPTCRSCSPENPSDDAPSSSSSSASVSSSESCAAAPKEIKVKRRAKAGRVMSCSSSVTDDGSPAAKKRRRNVESVAVAVAESEEVFVKWSRELGLELGVNGNRVASRALGLCVGVPLRVAAATSFWLGLRFCGDESLATFQNLSRLEAISGVPAKLIVAAHAKLARVFTHRFQLQEGSDES
ncbi:B-box zinc finger protein 32 [Gastrolobium bilobum]|uniref:B-box zinc finger protein 32 n=1 Tax=Gastrolobium bilobum TaxID=150636 RepID=UPI002AB16E81|nr:B-box zinc finger protein 32 [Gastrolobium bilobum]